MYSIGTILKCILDEDYVCYKGDEVKVIGHYKQQDAEGYKIQWIKGAGWAHSLHKIWIAKCFIAINFKTYYDKLVPSEPELRSNDEKLNK